MESAKGVPLEDETRVNVQKSNGEGSTLDVNKENFISNSHVSFSGGNEVPKDEITDKDDHKSSGPDVMLSATVSNIKTSNQSKESNCSGPKNNKFAKNQSNSKVSVVFGRSTKSSFTQSLSFPARGRHSDVMKRSIEVYPTKSDVRQSQKNSSKVESQVSNGNVSSCRRINPAGKKPFPGVNSKNVTNASRRTSLPSLRQSMVKFFSFLYLLFLLFFLFLLLTFFVGVSIVCLKSSLGNMYLPMELRLICTYYLTNVLVLMN